MSFCHVTLTIYAPARQPYWLPSLAPWSAGTLDIINSTVAVWQWHRNQASVICWSGAIKPLCLRALHLAATSRCWSTCTGYVWSKLLGG